MAISPRPPMLIPPTQATPAADWPDEADAFVTSQYQWTLAFNAQTIPELNQAITDINSAATTSGQNATNAANSATIAGQHKDAAATSAAAALASQNSASGSATAASNAATAAEGYRDQTAAAVGQAEGFRDESEDFRDEAQQFRDEAQAIVIGDAIDDTSLEPYQVRSAQNASIGHFRNVPMAASGAIQPLDFAQITAAGSSITVTLPGSPLIGQLFMVGNLTSRVDHLIAVGSSPVKGATADGFIVFDKALFTITLKYVNATYGWEIMQ